MTESNYFDRPKNYIRKNLDWLTELLDNPVAVLNKTFFLKFL